jgi:outer membrane protein TolC
MRNNNCKHNLNTFFPNGPALYGCVLFLIAAVNFGSVFVRAGEHNHEGQITEAEPHDGSTITIESLLQLVFDENPEVVSARYALEVAEFQFKDFVRNLSQFTPFLSRSYITRNQRRYEEEQAYSTRVGIEKEFFDGSSISTGFGHHGHFGDPESGTGQFLDTDITFPLFGSYTTLRRITSRSREENELFNARLEYVDEIRDNIREAQYHYFDLLTTRENKAKRIECIEAYKGFLSIPRVQSNPVERDQIETTIQSEEADMLRLEETLNHILIHLRFSIGLSELSPSQVNSFDLYSEDYYGKSYLSRTVDELLAEANLNDINIKVLENARESSVEKKRLAEEGKWDVFMDLNGRYDINGDGALRDDNGYLMGAGLRATKIDPVLLGYSLGRAVAEINEYDALIREQQLRTKNQIDQEWFIARNRRKEYEELLGSVESEHRVYLQKRKDYAEGKETIDNLIDYRKELMNTQMNVVRSLHGFYWSIVRLDHACGVYYKKLGINLEELYEEESIPGTAFSLPLK